MFPNLIWSLVLLWMLELGCWSFLSESLLTSAATFQTGSRGHACPRSVTSRRLPPAAERRTMQMTVEICPDISTNNLDRFHLARPDVTEFADDIFGKIHDCDVSFTTNPQVGTVQRHCRGRIRQGFEVLQHLWWRIG